MRHSRTAEEIGTLNIEVAARYGKPSAGVGGIDGHFILNVPFTRDVPLPEPVDTDWVNGRPPGGWETCFPFCVLLPAKWVAEWEEGLIRAARERERRLELGLLAGIGQP